MTSPVLFSTGASPSSSVSRNLVEFKAGKMEIRDKMVHPIKRPGLVYLRQAQDDSLMHFCWKDRQTGVLEDDLILFPDDCEFKPVKECTTGRVFVLKMKSSNKKLFFWMQESKTDRDEEYCKKINELLNNPPRAGSDAGGSGGSSSERDLQQLFGNMSQDQIAHLLSSNGVNLASLLNAAGRSPSSNSGASASSTASTTNSAPTSASSAISGAQSGSHQDSAATGGSRDSTSNMNDLRALLSGALMDGSEDEVNALMAATMAAGGADPETVSAGVEGARQQDSSQQQPMIDLSTAINSESLAHLLNDEQFLRQIETHVPQVEFNGSPLSTQFADSVRSSQFRSSLSQFCVALQSGQLGPLMSQFGLNQACVDAANLGNLEAFVRALEAQMGANTATTQPSGGGHQQPPPTSDNAKDKN